MKVKKFVAATMPEAMKKIRSNLGSEAVILQSREIKDGGFLGLFKKRKIEVVAALDPKPHKQRQKTGPYTDLTSKHSYIHNNDISEQRVIKEIKHLKHMLENQASTQDVKFTLDYQTVYSYLLDQEVDQTIAETIVATVADRHAANNIAPTTIQIVTDVQTEIENYLEQISFQGITYDQQTIHFVGPTGVGKTTTLAKLAARSMLQDRKQVAFVTTDTYRIAAIEQLKTYARILDVPIEVAYSIEDYKRALKKFSDVDLIFVDTAGRNYRHEEHVNQLTKQVQSNPDVKIYLVLSLTTKANDITDIYKQFSHLPIQEVIFTKIDETYQYGSMLNLASAHNVGIAYITNGQDVPDDIIKPSAKLISEYLMSDYYA